MPLSDIATINITSQTAGVAQAGFGVPLILSFSAAWVERIRFYSDITGVGLDFATTTPEYKAAAAMFSQNPKLTRIAIGRCALKPTQRWKITVASVLNLQAYKVRVGANTATFTSDGTATNDEIIAGLSALIAAFSGDTCTPSVLGSVGSQYLQIIGDAPGNWNEVEIPDWQQGLLTIEMDHADPGVATDLAAILLADSTWYTVVNDGFNSKAMVTAIATWVEANKKLFVGASQESLNATGAAGGADAMSTVKTAAWARTSLLYHPNNGAFAGAAWVGRCLCLDPGSETWMFKTLAGVAPVVLTATHQANIEAKSGNYYYTVAGVNITKDGKVAAGEYIDVIRFRDWLEARIAESVYGALVNASKVPYTDPGIAVVETEVRARLKDGVDVGGLAADPLPTVTVPKAKDAAGADKTARILRGLKFNATLAGAIHKIVIDGNVTV